ncbi:MAG: hypothetical protein J0L82_18415 [Deltaproteobacteria bacterium]|nr:hypothetical protein [Deltaproteobacteria bacterium]
MKSSLWYVVGISLTMVSCTTSGKKSDSSAEKHVIETSFRKEPEWLRDTRMNWEDGEYQMFRSSYSVGGHQRVNGCVDLAKSESKEALITEIANDIRGEIVRATSGIEEAGDEGLTKTWVEKFKGDTRGLRFVESAYERAIVNNVERVECFVLGRIKNSDYAQIKTRILAGAARTDSRVRKLLEDRQANVLSMDMENLAEKSAKVEVLPVNLPTRRAAVVSAPEVKPDQEP